MLAAAAHEPRERLLLHFPVGERSRTRFSSPRCFRATRGSSSLHSPPSHCGDLDMVCALQGWHCAGTGHGHDVTALRVEGYNRQSRMQARALSMKS